MIINILFSSHRVQVESDTFNDTCCKMGQDLVGLVDDTKSSDVKFILDGDKVVHAHR